MTKTKKLFLTILCFGLICVLGISAYAFCVTENVKLDETKLYKPFDTVTYLDINGQEIDNYSKSIKKFVTFDELPKYYTDGLVAVEDKRFYKHHGLDYKRIIKAFYNNLKSRSYKEGASTITQQLIKNTHLSNDKTIRRKLQEAKLAIQLENKYTKKQILEAYANSVYYGNNIYGIYSASKFYFDKDVEDLSLKECAVLIGMLKAPNKYNVKYDETSANKRGNTVLKCMHEQGYIDYNEYTSSVTITAKPADNDNGNISSYYLARVNEEINEIANPYLLSGCTVYTNYDEPTQRILDKELTVSPEGTTSVIAIKDGKVLAYASNCTSEPLRNPASTIKPLLVYAPALQEKKIVEISKLNDSPMSFNGYSPKNYGDEYYGTVSAKTALSKSLNVPTVSILNSLTVKKANEYLNKTSIKNNVTDLSCALGNIGEGTTLKKLTESYSVFNGNGTFTESKYIERIVNSDGKEIYKTPNVCRRVFDEDTALIIDDMLMDCVKNGTAKKLSELNFDVCAKTGTNGNESGNFDAYTIAYTTDIIIGAWIGNENTALSNNITGGSYPSIICKDVLNKLYNKSTPQPFDIESRLEQVAISKNAYNDNDRIVLANEYEQQKNIIYTYFVKGTKPVEYDETYVTPRIIDYEISDKSDYFEIVCKTDENVEYVIYKNGKEIYNSNNYNGHCKIYSPKTTDVYSIKAYYRLGEKINFGNEIILPKLSHKKEISGWENEY